MNYVTENITPAKAQEYLKTSIGNRPISKVFVRSYADTMKQGKWLLNGVPIIFDIDGHLRDGHHRLYAVIEAGIPVRFDVCRGTSAEAFTTYDCGRHRTVGQLLAMQQVKNYNLVGSIVIANERLISCGRLLENNSGSAGNRTTNSDKYELYRKDPDGYGSVASYICALLSRCRMLSGSWAGGLYYYLTHTGGYTDAEVKPFFEEIFSVETTKTSACNILRKAITNAALSGKKIKAETLWAYIVKAWNSFISGKEMKVLRYVQGQEVLPELILKQS